MNKLENMAKGISALGHTVRLEIVQFLINNGDGINLALLSDKLKLAPSTLKHHITHLEKGKIIVLEKKGRQTLTSLNHEAIRSIGKFIEKDCCCL